MIGYWMNEWKMKTHIQRTQHESTEHTAEFDKMCAALVTLCAYCTWRPVHDWRLNAAPVYTGTV